jgi:hypothetical protein
MEEGPPPLEDMTDFLAKRQVVQPQPKATIVSPSDVPQPKPTASGLKKGFFSAPKAKRKKAAPELPLLKPKAQRNPLELADVQAAMQYTETNQAGTL